MIVAIWKPSGPTSFQIIYQLREITGEKRIGHAGTLDPLASGVLIIGIGRESTKQLDTFMHQDKAYTATLVLGKTSSTDDSEGEIKDFNLDIHPTVQQVQAVISDFIGDIQQIPPIFSAIKIKGKNSYELARKGKAVELKSRQVSIYSIKIITYNYPSLQISVECGKGTYIRSLARDIGDKLKTGAHITQLTRTKVGNYSEQNSLTLEQFKQFWIKQQ